MRTVPTPNDVLTLGFWSALLTGAIAIAWSGAFAYQATAFPMEPALDLEAYAASFSFLRMINLVPALLLTWAFVVMMVCVHAYAPPEKRIWTLSALAFSIIYAVMADINYLIQLVAVGPSIQAGQLDGLRIFIGDNNFSSVFWALANAYAIQSLALAFAAEAFRGNLAMRWIRWIWIVVGVTAPFQLAFSLQAIPMLAAIPVLAIWIIGIPLSSFLLAAHFKQMQRAQVSTDLAPGAA